MKRLYKTILPVLAALAVIAGCVKEEGVEVRNTPAIDVTHNTLVPNADESGTVARAYVSTQVTAKGFNLDRVGLVTVDGIEAPIVEVSLQTLVFEIPALPAETYPQQDDPYAVNLKVYDSDCETVIFDYPYYVTVPVTDAIVESFSPAEGTVGTEVTITGRNLYQLTKVIFADVEVPGSAFLFQPAADVDEGEVRVAVPEGITVAGADTEIDITAIWSGGSLAVTTEESKFLLRLPVFDVYEPEGTLALDQDIVLTGRNLDLIKAVRWGEFELGIKEQSATSLTVNISATIPEQDPAEVTCDLIAEFGDVTTTVIVAEDVTIDTSPIPLPPPELVSAVPSEPEYANLYLGREVTVSGQNLFSLASVTVDNIEVTVEENSSTATGFKFVMPAEISGTVARDVVLKVADTDGNEDELTIKVYPFYYTKGLKLGLGCNSNKVYSDNGRNYSFLLLNEGKVISAEEWAETEVDKNMYDVSGANPVISGANKIASGATADDYYAVEPYLFSSTASNLNIYLHSPAGTNNRVAYHFYPGNTALPKTYGTPVIAMRTLSSDDDIQAAAAAGTIEDILVSERFGSAHQISMAAEGTSSKWTIGNVILVQYLTFEQGQTGNYPADASGVMRQGYIYIRNVTDIDSDFKAIEDAANGRTSLIEFDLYWSNPLNE